MSNSLSSSPSSHRNAAETDALLRQALVDTLSKANSRRIPLLLTGGTAVAAYAGTHRPLSLDLDFFVFPDNVRELEEVFGGSFKTFSAKPLFKSHKLVGHSGSVDLDFITEQHIVPDESRLEDRITLRITPRVLEHAIETEYLGSQVRVMPPEYILIAKLFAGRGIDLGKYDLVDCKNLIDSGAIRPHLLQQALVEISNGNSTIVNILQNRLLKALAAIPDAKDISDIQTTVASLTYEAL